MRIVYNQNMTTIRRCETREEWDEEVLSRGGHPLQLWGWGETKAAHGWRAERVFVVSGEKIIGAAQILVRRLPFPLKALAYIPRGPVAEQRERGIVLEALAAHAKAAYGAVALTVEPDWEDMPEVEEWRRSDNTILIPRTLILDLKQSEERLLEAMAKKTRQYIRKSAKDIEVRKARRLEEIDACLALYRQTAARAGFAIHDDQYYHDIFANLGEHSPVFVAYAAGQPVAFLWLAISESTAFELYGGMNDEGQRVRANYALKWHAITTMKKWGLECYDFNGLLNDGVSTFKQGFASHESMLSGTYDRPLSPLYWLWNTGLPLAKRAVRVVRKR